MRRRPVLAGTVLLALGAAAAVLPASAAPAVSDHLLRPLAGPDSATFPGAEVPLGDVDDRGPALAPLASARAAVAALGGDVQVAWNRFGTPRSLVRPGAALAEGLPGGTAEQVARAFLQAHSGLLGLTAGQVDALRLETDVPLSSSDARVVSFTQVFDGLLPAHDGRVAVTVRGDAVFALTGSAVGAQTLNATAPRLGALDAVLRAARDAGVSTLGLDDLTLGKVDGAGYQLVLATGLAQPQRARLRALPTTDGGARLVWETLVVDVAAGRALGAITSVDALDGRILKRQDAVDTLAAGAGARSVSLPAAGPSVGTPFQGSFTAEDCSAPIPLAVPEGSTTIVVAAAAVLPSNDIVVNVVRTADGESNVVGTQDTGTSPEVAVALLDRPAAAGDAFAAEVCPFEPDAVQEPYDFAGSYATSDVALPQLPGLPDGVVSDGSVGGPAVWKAFPSNPALPSSPAASPDDRATFCSGSPDDDTDKAAQELAGCRFLYADASPYPYDVDPVTGLPTFTTLGNNALTTNAQFGPSIGPGAPLLPPVDLTRTYAPAFTDSWHTSSCDPAAILDPTRNRADVDAAIVNLFVGHNRIHDFAYLLGLTETTGALQTVNFGKGGMEGDPETGYAQNAAATSQALEAVSGVTVPATGVGLTGRNNANQLTLPDGVPGITNQYLFQPVVGFYGPCADGGLDASIYLHEYMHAVSNRLVGGPNQTMSGEQSGAMGESWSDLVAVEFLQAFGEAGLRGEDPYAVGAYATGDPIRGIRDFNLHPSKNPLTYGEYGFDTTGPEVHADGEIWNAIQMTVREALVEHHRKRANPDDRALQVACATGRTAAGAAAATFDGCPGNRRWVAYLFDGMLMEANSGPTMVDIKDNMLAAAVAGGHTADYEVMGKAFASRGLGAGAFAVDAEDTDPVPSFASPVRSHNATVTFRLVDAVTGEQVPGKVFAGTFQARATPVADLGAESPDASEVMAGGTYSFVVQAPGYGLQRFTETLRPGTSPTRTFRLDQNVASAARGAQVEAPGAVRAAHLIDDDEATNAGFDGTADETPVAGRAFTVDLAGEYSRITKVAVSALHRPVDADDETDFQGRLLGVRAFDLQASTDGGETFTTVYSSPDDFFPADAPRAVAPDLQLRTVTLPKPVVANALRLVVRTNTCTGAPGFAQDLDADPLNTSDCTSVPENALRVTATELQAFGSPVDAPVEGSLGATGTGDPAAAGGAGGTSEGTAGERAADAAQAGPAGTADASATAGGSAASPTGANGTAGASAASPTGTVTAASVASAERSLPRTGAAPAVALAALLLLGTAGAIARRSRPSAA